MSGAFSGRAALVTGGSSGIGRGRGPSVDERVLGDPDHIARAVLYVLEQPINVNLQEIVIRPPVSIEF